ncbi:MAG: hypothetical protein RI988_3930 [Pseudomonadota bacterium]|jgi:thiol-disulfide isomerase/thioredoxin
MNRRSAAVLATGAVALAAGAGWRWLNPFSSGGSPGSAVGAAGADAEGALWALRLDRPEGGELVFAELRGRPLVVNFWATWCPPCIRELPELDRFHQAFRPQGWQVVGIAVDGPTPVREFLAKRPLGFPTGLAGLAGADLARQLGNTSGGLPFTVVLDAAGRITQRKLGATTYEELAGWASPR